MYTPVLEITLAPLVEAKCGSAGSWDFDSPSVGNVFGTWICIVLKNLCMNTCYYTQYVPQLDLYGVSALKLIVLYAS